MRRSRAALCVLGLSAVLFLVGALGVLGFRVQVPAGDEQSASAATSGPVRAGSLDATITRLQARLHVVPKDYVAWASLGLAYVQQAKVTVNPAYYSKAQDVLERSLRINSRDNYIADAGRAALAAARHDFSGARGWAEKGLTINSSNALLYGALDDAETQLGHYEEAFAATQRMVDLAPDTASLARVSYSWEIRGHDDTAREYMQRALEDATAPADQAFAHYYLGELAFNHGDFTGALTQYRAGTAADPASAPCLEGQAKALAASGQSEAAVAAFADVVSRVPQPTYVIEYGELLESLGRIDQAHEQYRLFETEQRLFESNGVVGDVEPTLFSADHGQAARALEYGRKGITRRSFLEMDDAYAWALHVNGRDREALDWSQKALRLGTQSPLFHYHAGMINMALGQLDAARAELTNALQLNPHFNPLAAPIARQALTDLEGTP